MINEAKTTQTQPTDDTWQEIEGLVDEIARLAKSDLPTTQFHTELLDRAVCALAAPAGAIWLSDHHGKLNLNYQVNLRVALDHSDQHARSNHDKLLTRVMAGAEATTVAPRSGTGDSLKGENPTQFLLVLCPLIVDDEPVGVVEVFQHSDKSPAVQRGNVQLLTVLGELAVEFHRNARLRQLRDRERMWNEFDQFVCHIHQVLDVDAVAYAIANDGRHLSSCDRLSVLIASRRKCRLRCISGLDTFDRRSGLVRRMEELANYVLNSGEHLWYRGADEHSSQNNALQAYLNESNAHSLAVVPLNTESNESNQTKTIGVLVAEHFDASAINDETCQRIEAIARHGATALNNATTVANLPLMPVVRAIGRLSWFTRLRQLPITVLVLGAIVCSIIASIVVPADFNIEGRGELQPVDKQVIFAPYDGTIVELPSPPADKSEAISIAANEEVVVLHNTDLEYEMTSVVGEKQTTKQQLDAISNTLTNMAGRSESFADRTKFDELTAKKGELAAQHESLTKRLDVLRRQQAELTIRASISGQIQTWDVVEKLRSRPVRQGQKLMTIVNPDGSWVLEMYVPDRYINHVQAAQKKLDDELEVSFILKSDPGVTYRGSVEKVAMSTEIDDTHGASVLVTVRFDASQLTERRPGTTVIAKIHCGRESIGYVWLHDLIDAVRSRLLF